MGKLKDKIILITGGTSGIGTCMAEVFASEGAQTIVTGRNREQGEKDIISLKEQIEKDYEGMKDEEIISKMVHEIYRCFCGSVFDSLFTADILWKIFCIFRKEFKRRWAGSAL